ncbi:hypothetical protein D0859_05612 [Hortaea werneckii]|uniref:Uncharacterized protein n=1 Tax=Hortaea werneckii TaxID=91943 RepID=A0A3M7IXM8_HORWE|nr:hypothetical protein D0859_05612 [Hortaea werneckii]
MFGLGTPLHEAAGRGKLEMGPSVNQRLLRQNPSPTGSKGGTGLGGCVIGSNHSKCRTAGAPIHRWKRDDRLELIIL